MWLRALEILALLYVVPIGFNVLVFLVTRRPLLLAEDESPASLLPPPSDQTARVRILFSRGHRFRAIFGGHSFLVYKRQGAADYVRYDWDGRGEPIRNEGWVAYERGYGGPPGFQYAADGWLAEQLIPQLEASIAAYAKRHVHDYAHAPGPNSNTFMQGVIDGVPKLDAVLTTLAVGRDYPHDGRPIRRLHSGVLLTLGGYVAMRIGWVEGFELSLFCQVLGVDWRRPAIKLPSIGRIGLSACPKPDAPVRGGRVMMPEQRTLMEERRAERAYRPMGPGPQGGGRIRMGRRR
jgi:hypothetical protein